MNGSTGNDSVSWAANDASNPWRTIGRAAWGSTNRAAPNASEAARAGDTVNIAGGTYANTSSVSQRFEPLYNPANSGTAGNYITFTCTGDCRLEAPNANSPVIGAQGRNYIKWFADVTQGHSWIIPACGRMDSCAANTVNTTADTGPVVCNAATGFWVEGAVIDGGAGIDFADNWNAFRLENCSSSMVRNNDASNFTRDIVAGNTNHNQSIITLYGSQNAIVEHNIGRNAGAGVFFKDTGTTNPQSGNVIRFNRFTNVGQAIAFSVTAENRNYIYQNTADHSDMALGIVGGGLGNDWIFNNTFYSINNMVGMNQSGTGGRFWNNICYDCGFVITPSAGTMVPSSVIDFQHNVYNVYSQFYSGSDGNRTFASYMSAFPDQDHAAPATIDANPLFVNAAGNDLRLQPGSPALARGVDLMDLDGDGSTTDIIPAGAYLTGNEVIGPLTTPGSNPGSACDLNVSGAINVVDTQLCVNQAIGMVACTTGDINHDSQCNVVDVQRVVNAALGGQCVTQ